MSRIGDSASGIVRAALPESMKHYDAAALQRELEDNAEELLWIAEVMAGSAQAGELVLAEAIKLAEAAQPVGREWILSGVKRLLVQTVLKRIGSEIPGILTTVGPRSAATMPSAGVSEIDRKMLRSISSQWIIASFNVLERACFILYAYLKYPTLDCALILGCPRAWVVLICEYVLTKIGDVSQPAQDGVRSVESFTSPGGEN